MYVDDASTDGSAPFVREVAASDPRLDVWVRSSSLGPLRNRIDGARLCGAEPNDVVVYLDGDDWFLGRDALGNILQTYVDRPETWATYGSYVSYNDSWAQRLRLAGPEGLLARLRLGLKPETRPYPRSAWSEGGLRAHGWRCGHPLTFRRHLLDRLQPEALHDRRGRILRSATDLAMTWPLLEVAGPDRVVHIEKPLVVYNKVNPLRLAHTARRGQRRAGRRIARLPPRAQESGA